MIIRKIDNINPSFLPDISVVNELIFSYLSIMEIKEYSPHIFWSYKKNADLEPGIVIRQVIAYGEVKDKILLASLVEKKKILEVIMNWKDREKFDKQIHFFQNVIL